MKTNCWMILGTLIATTAVAQVNTNKLPEIPPPALAAPVAPAPVMAPAETKPAAPVKKAAVHAKGKVVKKAKAAAKPVQKKLAELLPVALVPGPATVTADHVNLRGQVGLKGEVVGHVQKGDTVTVLSAITLDKLKADEPAQWAKIALPAGSKVWVDSQFVDPSNNVVAVKKLNLRGGPGENYSVLGVIEKGTSLTAVSTKGGWTQIEPPASAFAFIAAGYLKQESSGNGPGAPNQPVVAATQPVAPMPKTVPPPAVVPPTPTTVTEPQPIAPPAATPPTTPETVAPATAVFAPPNTPAAVTPALVVPTPSNSPEVDTNLPPPPPRVVTHEGSVRPSVSPVAPTYFELYDPTTDKAINYLYSTSTNLNLSRYNGLHITVKGEEGLDSRWSDTPVLTIQQIYVLSGTPKPAEPQMKPVKKHWWQK